MGIIPSTRRYINSITLHGDYDYPNGYKSREGKHLYITVKRPTDFSLRGYKKVTSLKILVPFVNKLLDSNKLEHLCLLHSSPKISDLQNLKELHLKSTKLYVDDFPDMPKLKRLYFYDDMAFVNFFGVKNFLDLVKIISEYEHYINFIFNYRSRNYPKLRNIILNKLKNLEVIKMRTDTKTYQTIVGKLNIDKLPLPYEIIQKIKGYFGKISRKRRSVRINKKLRSKHANKTYYKSFVINS